MDNNSESPQQPKQQRRKRKDPQSRDFVCKCGKSYLSYAAAYTHVKNKHKGDNQYLTNISKPDREKLKRGRPKEKKVFSITPETEKLSIVEQAILQIFEALQKAKDNSSKIILEGNQQIRLDQLIIVYEQLKKQFGEPGLTLFMDHDRYGENGKMLTEFIESLNKHFTPHIAVKIIWFINYIFVGQVRENTGQGDEQVQGERQGQGYGYGKINMEKVKDRVTQEKCIRLWEGIEEIPVCIFTALDKWIKIHHKGTTGGENGGTHQ